MTSATNPPAQRRFGNWFFGWNALGLSIFVVAMTMGIIFSSFTFFVLAWMDDFGVDRGEAMITLAITQLLAGVISPFGGRAMDRLSIRWVGVTGLLAFAAGLFLLSLATSMWQIMAIYAVFFSMAFSLAGPILAQTMAAKWFRKRRGFAIGLASLGSSIGGFAFPPVTAMLIQSLGWRPTTAVLAVFVVVVGLPAFGLFVRNSPQDKGVDPEPENPVLGARPLSDNQWTTRKILSEKTFWLLVLAFLPLLFMTSGFTINLGPYTRDLELSTANAAMLMSLWAGVMIVGKLGFGYLTDRYNHRLLFVGMLVFYLCALFVLSLNPGITVLMAAIVMLALVSGGLMPIQGAMISHFFGPLAFGSVLGLFSLFIRPVAFAGPLGGWIRDTQGSYDLYWLGGMVVSLVLGSLIFFAAPSAAVAPPVAANADQ